MSSCRLGREGISRLLRKARPSDCASPRAKTPCHAGPSFSDDQSPSQRGASLHAEVGCEEADVNVSLPKVTIYGTGGTIAGAAKTASMTSQYDPGVLPVSTLVDDLPELLDAVQPRAEEVVNVGSPDVGPRDLILLSQNIQRELDGDTQGVVITHGTDTIEETAYFLELTVKSDKPVVLVGSMRPPTARGADGPMNLLCAVNLAVSQGARSRGVMIVLNDRICPSRFTTKSHANMLDSFKAAEEGYLGIFVDSQPLFFYPPCRPLARQYFDISARKPEDGLPIVDILFGHSDVRPELFEAAVRLGAKGIVLAGMGSGCWSKKAGTTIQCVAGDKGERFPIVTSRRTPSGFVGGEGVYGLEDSCIGGGFLDPQKCRIQLQLALAAGLDTMEIRGTFEGNKPGAETKPLLHVAEWQVKKGDGKRMNHLPSSGRRTRTLGRYCSQADTAARQIL
ncbi:Asparaginase/glutaminase [Drechmeria coniospora]|uniref:asparaginase n=1 Tax=Drechmeria coniospora TaxID=98403 RepID=A0A151GNB3_DRECN|nr:Asparaginase/glutaminase [Drechmeria coniospora]KYK58586.1 Asparaginase/glutaminase [Drechmeria coniospora]ODA83949.1 hypothetical protein RJ55_02466 [Drechmeria coniospora]